MNTGTPLMSDRAGPCPGTAAPGDELIVQAPAQLAWKRTQGRMWIVGGQVVFTLGTGIHRVSL